MKINSEALKMLQELSNAPGASGFEEEVVKVARRWAEPIGEIKEDFLRNLYIRRKENTGNKPMLMIDAHSDEVGLIVQAIKPNGTLRFLQLGSWAAGTRTPWYPVRFWFVTLWANTSPASSPPSPSTT